MAVLADRYELGALVGSGGMARVLQARDLILERPVAVKLLREGVAADPAARERFLREARTAARFNHPNAVAVFDSGQEDGDPWIVMELVDGEDLSQRLRRLGPLSEPEAVAIADCVLAALEAAHRQGIVHRDVKPANIMLLDDGTVKLADFGIAKSLQEAAGTITGTGQIMGTARYLAPEQVNGRAATPASDVYAMGIVLYEMLVGRAPFTGSDALAVAVAHTSQAVPDIAQAVGDVSPELAAVVTTALAKDPADRFADAGVMRRALAAGQLGATAVTLPVPLASAPAPTLADATLPLASAAGGGTTQVLDQPAGTTPVVDDDAVTLDPGSAAPRRPRHRPWGLIALIALPLLAAIALAAAGIAGDSPTEAPGTDPVVRTAPSEPAGAAEPAAPEARDATRPAPDAQAERPAQAKGNGNGKAKGKGKKD